MNKPIYPNKASDLANELNLTTSELMHFRKDNGLFDKLSVLTNEQIILIKEKFTETKISEKNTNKINKEKLAHTLADENKRTIRTRTNLIEGDLISEEKLIQDSFLKINSIYIENYKSYEKITYNCNHSFNLIIGENNMGKTTLFDAMLLWDMAYSKLITTKKSFYKPLANDRDIILTHEDLSELRFADIQYIFNNHLEKCKIGFNFVSEEGVLFNLTISFEKPTEDGAYLILSIKDQYDDFSKFHEYCKTKNFNIRSAISVKISKPIANIIRRENYLNTAFVSFKSNTGYSFEVLRNKIINTMDAKKFPFLERKLEKILGHSFKIRLKSENRDKDLYIPLTIQQGEDKEVDLSLVGSGVLNLLEILSSLHNKSEGTNLVLLDEPDSHIHSDIQHKLVEQLKIDNSNTQVFIISHNEKLIYSVDESERFFIDREAKQSGQLNSLEESQLLKLQHDLASKIETIEKNNKNKPVIFVEGKTDREILKSVMNKINPKIYSMIDIKFKNGHSGVKDMALSWYFSRIKNNAALLLDCDDGAKESIDEINNKLNDGAIRNFKFFKLSDYKPPHIMSFYSNGVKLNYAIEEMFDIDIWKNLQSEGMLEIKSGLSALIKDLAINKSFSEHCIEKGIPEEHLIYLNKVKKKMKINSANYISKNIKKTNTKVLESLIMDVLEYLLSDEKFNSIK